MNNSLSGFDFGFHFVDHKSRGCSKISMLHSFQKIYNNQSCGASPNYSKKTDLKETYFYPIIVRYINRFTTILRDTTILRYTILEIDW